MEGRGRSKRHSHRVARVGGAFGWPDGGSQSGQGATGLILPRPALGKMQGDPACRAGEPSDEGEEPPPEGLGGHDLLTQPDAGCPAGQVVGSSGVLPAPSWGGALSSESIQHVRVVLVFPIRMLTCPGWAMQSLSRRPRA